MQTQNVDFPAGHTQPADVGTPQVGNLVEPSYHSEFLSVMVAAGRAKSAFNSEQVQEAQQGSEAPQERWSRGCRRAYVSFWFWQWFRQSPLAPKKKKSWLSRLRSKPSTPASTSNLPERAFRYPPDRPAPNPGLLRNRAVVRPKLSEIFGFTARTLWAFAWLSPIRPAIRFDRSEGRC
jgi:hypothetical protein